MGIDKKSEILFILIILLMVPTLYLFTETMTEAKYRIDCTPVMYVDSGIPGDNIDTIVRDDKKICGTRCDGYCMAEFGSPCKGVHHAIYSEIYGISCVCELYAVDKDFADECIDEISVPIDDEGNDITTTSTTTTSTSTTLDLMEAPY